MKILGALLLGIVLGFASATAIQSLSMLGREAKQSGRWQIAVASRRPWRVTERPKANTLRSTATSTTSPRIWFRGTSRNFRHVTGPISHTSLCWTAREQP